MRIIGAISDGVFRIHEDRTTIGRVEWNQHFLATFIAQQCAQGMTGAQFAFELNLKIGNHELDTGQNLFDFHDFSLEWQREMETESSVVIFTVVCMTRI